MTSESLEVADINLTATFYKQFPHDDNDYFRISLEYRLTDFSKNLPLFVRRIYTVDNALVIVV